MPPRRLIALFFFFFFTCVFTASAMDSDNPIDAVLEFGNVAAVKSTHESSLKNARSLADVSNSQSLADLDASNVAEGSIESSHPVHLNEASVQAQLIHSVTTSQAFDSVDTAASPGPGDALEAHPSVIQLDKAVDVVVVLLSTTIDASASIVDASEMSIVEFERSSEALGYLSACQPTLVDKLYKRYLLKRKAVVAVAAAKEAVAAAVAAAAAAVAAAFAAVAAAAAASEEADKALAYVRSRDDGGGGDRQK